MEVAIPGLKDLYDFSKVVSKHEVIVVRINYRLGPFGWFTHPAIQNYQNGDDKTSNFGTLDIIMALEWVKENISNFGGDPNNVLIFGESAGGHNVHFTSIKQLKDYFIKPFQCQVIPSISLKDAYKPESKSSTSNFSSHSVLSKLNENMIFIVQIMNDHLKREKCFCQFLLRIFLKFIHKETLMMNYHCLQMMG